MYYYGFKPYVSVAERKAQAAKVISKHLKKGHILKPVEITGRAIAHSFWGNAWCQNLEHYSDYENRLPRGRTYVRNGSVIDLNICPGQVTAMVSGSSVYQVTVTVAGLADKRWKALCADCAGSIDSLVELLGGKLSKAVMERMCNQKTGLFPSPKDIKFACSCPDWAYMCKHVAAVLYGTGARLDQEPELLFTLRNLDVHDLVANAGKKLTSAATRKSVSKRIIAADEITDIFGLDMAAPEPEKGTKTEMKAKAKTKAKTQRENTTKNKPDKVKEKPDPRLDLKIGNLDLSTRAMNILIGNGYEDVRQIVNTSDKELLLHKNMGMKTFTEIRDKIAAILE